MSDDECPPCDLQSEPTPMISAKSHREIRVLQISIAWLIALRLWMMATYPLIDTTEARYGELARMTAEGGFWLMPHITPTEPFFAKPPLSTWLAAGAWQLLSNDEFGLRLPSLLMASLTAWLLWLAARDFNLSRAGRWITMTMLVTAPIFVVSAGAVMTDATQMAVVTGAMVVAWRALREPQCRRWRVFFWTLLGVATLSKGLATLVLIGLPIVAYAVVGEGIAVVWRRLWDFLGMLVAATICLAWYVPAEWAYPGFLYYFVIGEHFQRFLQPGWQGDRFGTAKSEPLGMIWLYWIAGTGLWLPVFVAEVRRLVRRDVKPLPMPDRWLWCWILTPLFFFTASRNIIMTYVLTAVPPFALAAGCWAESNHGRLRRAIPAFALGIAIVASVVGATYLPQWLEARSARYFFVNAAQTIKPPAELFVHRIYPFSASFYSRGAARRVDDLQPLNEVLKQPGALLLVTIAKATELLKTHPLRKLLWNSTGVLLEVLEPMDSDR